MSTTATLTETEQPLTLPPKLWREYRLARSMGSKPRVASSAAFERVPGYTKGDTREKLAELLFAREAERGLVLSEEEREAELLAEAEGVEDVPAEPGSSAAVRADAQKRLVELEAQRAHLAPEALTDEAVREELLSIESEIGAARSMADLADTAETELQRREREATELAERQRQETENAAAAKLAPAVAKQKAVADRAFVSAVAEVRKLQELQDRHAAHLVAGGLDGFSARGVHFRPDDVESAIRFHFRGVGLFSRVTGRDHPLIPEVK